MTLGSVGLVHDYLLVRRGAERTFAEIAQIWPEAPVYTLLCDPAALDARLANRDIRTSYLQASHVRQGGFRKLLPLFPHAVGTLPVGDHDVVISSSSAFAHGIRPADGAIHVCYCHSPFRYVWHEYSRALGEVRPGLRTPGKLLLARIRSWDRRSARRVSCYIANSKITQERIARFYGRDSSVVHPPVEVERFRVGKPEGFFLIVTELVRHKQVELALAAARRAGRKVRVVGTGPEADRLAASFAPHAEFLGRVDDSALEELYRSADALIMPNAEEFGIAAVEAMASGRPVVAAAAGGALETVRPGVTGELFPAGSEEALASLLEGFDPDQYSPTAVRDHAMQFSAASFRSRLEAAVESFCADPRRDSERAVAPQGDRPHASSR